MIEPVLMIVLTAILAVNVVLIALIFIMTRAFLRDFYSFMTPPGEEEKAPVENLIKSVGDSIGSSVVFHSKQAAFGKASGEARLKKAIEGDILQDTVAAGNPLLGMAMDNFPSLKKRALKNPGVIDWLLSNLGSAKAFNRPDNGGGVSDFAERLKKYS